MSDQPEASGSRPRTPTSTLEDAGSAGPSSASQQDVTRLENDLIPSPPASEAGPSSSTAATYTNVDGSARVYRFPNDLPPSFAGTPAEPASNPNDKVVTVRDLRSKTCWICSDEDEDPPAPASPTSPTAPGSVTRTRKRRFIHPCNCTLVAHESCLLRWVEQQKRDHPLKDSFTCPQCKTPYIITNHTSPLLKLIDHCDRLVSRIEPVAAITLLGGSVLVALTTYGCVAIRMFLGKDAARRALASPWPWHYWLDIPLIPFALIAARLNIFESAMFWVPTVVAFPLMSPPMATAFAAHGRLLDRYLESGAFNARAYPPGPALTALLVPWVRVFYLAIRRRVYRAVLSPFYRNRRRDEFAPQPNGARRRRVIVIGEPDRFMVDTDVAAAEAVRVDRVAHDGIDAEDDPNEPNWQFRALRGEEANQTIYVSHHSLGRLCLGALTFPFVANIMGRILGYLARFSPLLARFLGMKISPAAKPSSILSSFYTTKATPTSGKDGAPSPSPIASLFRGHIPLFDGIFSWEVKPSKQEAAGYGDRLTMFSNGSRYDDLDPVWWRNAVGAGLYVLLRDTGSLVYRYLRLSQRGRTSIKDLPFQKGLVSGLDLKQ